MRNAVTFLVIFISLKIDASPFGFKGQDNDALPFECQFIKLPEAIETFYDEILSNPGTHGQNLSLIRDTIAEDWNTRPNPLNPAMGICVGPFPEGLQKIMGAWSVIMPDISITRKETLVHDNDKIVVLSNFGATTDDLPPGFTEYPMFPGIDPNKLKGKSFKSMALDVHILDQGKIRRSWHFEDWTLALNQMLKDRPDANLNQPEFIHGNFLKEIPESINNFYENILSDASGGGQDVSVLSKSVHDDWNDIPEPFNPIEGKGPGLDGLKMIAGLFASAIPDLKWKKVHAFHHCDRVIVLSKISGTVAGAPPGFDEIPIFPGIPVEKLVDKKFETLALHLHRIVDGKMKQNFHIEDWATAVDQMVNDKPPPDFGLDSGYLNFIVPEAVENFYDKILSNPGTFGQNLTFIKESLADDWNTRPNALNPSKGIETGPFPEGAKAILSGWEVMMQDLYFERMHNFVFDDKVAVISRFGATMGDLPPGFKEYPMFPGIVPDRLKGKSFNSLAFDIHFLDKGKMRRTWHFEDWTDALDEMLKGRASSNLTWPAVERGEFLKEVPQCIYNLYDKIFSDPNGKGQDLALLEATLHKDWSVRPNPLNPVEGTGPGTAGLKGIMGLFGAIAPDMKFEIQKMWIHEDKVIVMKKVSGTVAGAPPGFDEIPLWPGIDPKKLIGKRFEHLDMDVHQILDGKLKRAYHIEDWQSGANQMLNNKPIPDYGLDEEYLQFTDFGWNLNHFAHKVPKAITNLYDKIVSNPSTYGQDLSLIQETLSNDYNFRPNLLNPKKGLDAGPFPNGFKMVMGDWSIMMPDLKVHRLWTLVQGDLVAVVSKFGATLNDLPPGLVEFPMFPGTPAEKIKGKSFQDIIAIGIHLLDEDGKIRRAWNIEDWSQALYQLLTGGPPASLELENLEPGVGLKKVPKCIFDLYEKVFNEKQTSSQLLREIVHDDWVERPNVLNPAEKGPGLNGLKTLIELNFKLVPNFKFDVKARILHEDKVIVLSKMSGTVAGALPGSNELPQFPGIPVEKLIGKKFETMAIDIHKIVDGKIKQSYHIEGWQTALGQMLNGTLVPDFGFDQAFIDF